MPQPTIVEVTETIDEFVRLMVPRNPLRTLTGMNAPGWIIDKDVCGGTLYKSVKRADGSLEVHWWDHEGEGRDRLVKRWNAVVYSSPCQQEVGIFVPGPWVDELKAEIDARAQPLRLREE
ncbi:MAG: hypothetical protein V1659_01975 [Candidatus Woesearchaeota archaeon]